MANIYPFKGFRYNKAVVGDLSLVVTQPYDKISESLNKEYLKRHPANIVRIIKNSDYLEAASLWHRWIQTGTLVQDGRPCLYIYRQNCLIDSEVMERTGFIGLISLDDNDLEASEHETIPDKPLLDRLKVMRATEANEGLIFTLYSDKEMQTDRILDAITGVLEPAVDVVDDFGVRNRVWCLFDQRKINEICGLLRGKQIYVAEGNQWFQASVLYNRECIEKDWSPGAEESFDKRMIAAFNMESPGINILPAHWAVRTLPDPLVEEIPEKAGIWFKVVKMENLRRLEERMAEQEHCFGMAVGKETLFYSLELKEEALKDPGFMPDAQGKVRDLDLTILHRGIFDSILGIDRGKVASGDYVNLFQSSNELIETLKNGINQLGFLVRPTTMEKVREVPTAGAQMPQDSIGFFPKLLTGLVMMKMEIEK